MTEVFRENPASSESGQEDTSAIMNRRQCEEQAYVLKQKGRKVTRQMTEFVEDDGWYYRFGRDSKGLYKSQDSKN